MRIQLCSSFLLASAGLLVFAAGCASIKERHVALAEMSAPARSTVERETAGGKVENIMREVERGKVVYDVEGRVGGKHLEWLIAEADGAILGTEAQIELSEAPVSVRDSAEKYFGTTNGLLVMKGVEYGETHYEVEGQKGGRKVEVTFDPNGKRAE